MDNKKLVALKDKKIKKKIIITILFILLIKIIYNIISSFYLTPNEIDELNENINIPYEYEFAAPFEQYNISKDRIEYDNGLVIYLDNKDGDTIGFMRYPDLSNSYKFAIYETTDPKITLFGLTVGDSLKEADRVLNDFGYDLYDIDTSYVEYYNGRVTIDLSIDVAFDENTDISDKLILENGTINGISIELESTDRFWKGNYK